MPSDNSSVQAQTEKPHHYTYLKEFRTQQCPLFLQHKCTQHRPFTCFHWHFMNQRRRRPVRKRDGTFSYSPDVYCTKYDETTGICPEGDECPLLHRTAGDTERRYHLRYYKTSVCVHETDSKGHCVKNGPHCAFAHGAHDLRPPVYDVRELQVMQGPFEKQILDTPLASSVEKDRLINEDPKWNDTNFVLANYKTESCKRPPRLCRQGYACPSYHNSRDRRRSPKKFKYRSTPCPNVKHGDDWGDPSQCDSGENCPYCHTRTEQQFHPEIYKSTKCNDMVQTGYCPRGPFCAFAHVEQEMTTHRDVPVPADNSLAAFVTNALPALEEQYDLSGKRAELAGGAGDMNGDSHNKDEKVNDVKLFNGEEKHNNNNNKAHVNQMQGGQSLSGNVITSVTPTDTNGLFLATSAPLHLPGPIGKGRTNSLSGSFGSDGLSSSYGKAPGSERELDSHHLTAISLRKQLQAIEKDPTLDALEKSKRKQNLLLLNSLNIPGSTGNSHNHGPISPSSINTTLPTTLGINATVANSTSYPNSTMSPNARSFYPPGDTVESVIGNALDEDLNLGELSLTSVDRELGRDNDNDTNSVCSSLSAGFSSAGTYVGASSVPVTIPSHPSHSGYRGSMSSLSPTCSPIGSIGNNVPPHLSQQQKQEQQLQEACAAFLSQPNPGKYSAPSFSQGYNAQFNGMSPRSNSISQSPLVGAPFLSNSGGAAGSSGGYAAGSSANDSQRLREELATNKAKLAQWEDGISQARNACEAWRKEAEEANRKAKMWEEEKLQFQKQRDESIIKANLLQKEVDQLRGGPFLHCLQRISELEALPIAHLKQLQAQLRLDLDTLEKIVYQQTATKCVVCHEKNRSVSAAMPCNHYVLCDGCLSKSHECPYCHVKLQPPPASQQTQTPRSNVILPMS